SIMRGTSSSVCACAGFELDAMRTANTQTIPCIVFEFIISASRWARQRLGYTTFGTVWCGRHLEVTFDLALGFMAALKTGRVQGLEAGGGRPRPHPSHLPLREKLRIGFCQSLLTATHDAYAIALPGR